GGQFDQPGRAQAGGLAGHVCDLDRAAELAAVLAPGDEALQELSGTQNHVACLADRLADGLERSVLDPARLAEGLVVLHADDTDRDSVSERIGPLDALRSGDELDLPAIADDDETDRVAGARRHVA